MEMKTIKHFLPLNGIGDGDVSEQPLLSHHELQEVANEWIKHIELRKLPHPEHIAEVIDSCIIDWIKHFFNLGDKND